jgi:type II secretory pathway component PulL
MIDDQRTPLQRSLERLELCKEVVADVHSDLYIPRDTEEKADLYLSVEELAREVFHLLNTVNDHIWPPSVPEDEE